MCGIVGAVANRSITTLLIEGLKRLEYRGYDSAGIAIIDNEKILKRLRVLGKVGALETAMNGDLANGHTGIAHTRWATHGAPSEKNAHPFISNDEFALVHNGIVENHHALRQQLMAEGYDFQSETDTEVVVHLIHKHYALQQDLLKAVQAATNQLEGAYSLGIIAKSHPHRLIAVRQGSPLVIGKSLNENFIASDPLALLTATKQFIYLEDNDIADIGLNGIHIYNRNLEKVARAEHTLSLETDVVERGRYRHFMKKEIMEQPEAIAACLEGRVANGKVLPGIFGPDAEKTLQAVEHIQLIACGTSYHAALVAKYWIEMLAQIPCAVEVASEFRYRDSARSKNSLFVTLSQSGETADTLAALRSAKKMNYLSTLTICNVPNSTMMREANLHFLTRAGVEIGVASTKAFVTQLTALFLLTLLLRRNLHLKDDLEATLVSKLQSLPAEVETILQQDDTIAHWAAGFTNKAHSLFLGRGALYPIALEGALKMKELSYIHAEGYPAGELKHGPLALVDTNMPVIAAAPKDALIEKMLSNLEEVHSRGGMLYLFTNDTALFNQPAFKSAHLLSMPTTHPALNPILYTIPMQLLAYHVAVLKGTDVDQPRNLAKSVTVE